MCRTKRLSGDRSGTDIRFVLIVVGILLSLSFAITEKELQNDTFYSIKIGEYLVQNGVFGQRADPFSWIDLPYTFPHWLFDIGIYALYAIGGYRAIYLACVFGAFLLGLIEYRIIWLRTGSGAFSLYMAAILLALMRHFIAARAQLLTYLLFGLELLILEGYLYRGKKSLLIGLPIIALIIANSHAAVFYFFFILALPYGGELVCLLVKRRKDPSADGKDSRELRRYYVLAGVVLASAVTGFLSPFQPTPFTYLPLTVMGSTTNYIQEHAAAVLWYDKPLLICIAVLLYLFLDKRYTIRQSNWFMLFGTLLMAVISWRHEALFYLLSGPVMADMSWQLINLVPNFEQQCDRFRRSHPYAICLFLIVGLVAVSTVHWDKSYINEEMYPTEAVEWMKSNLDTDDIRLFNTYNYGAYVLMNDIPVMIDSRADLYTPEFNRGWGDWGENGIDVFGDVASVTNGEVHYRDIFEEYGITHILIPGDSFLALYIAEDPNIECLYSDSVFSVYTVL